MKKDIKRQAECGQLESKLFRRVKIYENNDQENW